MTIYTRYIGPSNHHGSRIKVWTTWPQPDNQNRKIEKTYSYPYESSDEHTTCFLRYLQDLPATIREVTGLDYTPDYTTWQWSRGETMDGRGYVYTHIPVNLKA